MAKKFLTPIVPPILANDPSAIMGSIYFNSESKSLRFYDGTNWYTLSVEPDLSGGGVPELLLGGDAFTTSFNYYFDGTSANQTVWDQYIDGGGAVVH